MKKLKILNAIHEEYSDNGLSRASFRRMLLILYAKK